MGISAIVWKSYGLARCGARGGGMMHIWAILYRKEYISKLGSRVQSRVAIPPIERKRRIVRRMAGETRRYRFFKWASRNGEPRFSRRSSQCLSGMVKKTSTTFGSNWLPEQRLISSRAWDIGKALR